MVNITEFSTQDGTICVVLRLASHSDASSIAQAINSIAAERIHLAINSFAPSGRWERVLNAPEAYPDHLLMVPEVCGRIVGWCRVFPWRFGHKSSHVADLGIGILQPYRLKGIGTALLEKAIIWAEEQGYEKLTLSTFASNTVAVYVFTKMGFETTGVRRHQYKINGQYVDDLLMERFLGCP